MLRNVWELIRYAQTCTLVVDSRLQKLRQILATIFRHLTQWFYSTFASPFVFFLFLFFIFLDRRCIRLIPRASLTRSPTFETYWPIHSFLFVCNVNLLFYNFHSRSYIWFHSTGDKTCCSWPSQLLHCPPALTHFLMNIFFIHTVIKYYKDPDSPWETEAI